MLGLVQPPRNYEGANSNRGHSIVCDDRRRQARALSFSANWSASAVTASGPTRTRWKCLSTLGNRRDIGLISRGTSGRLAILPAAAAVPKAPTCTVQPPLAQPSTELGIRCRGLHRCRRSGVQRAFDLGRAVRPAAHSRVDAAEGSLGTGNPRTVRGRHGRGTGGGVAVGGSRSHDGRRRAAGRSCTCASRAPRRPQRRPGPSQPCVPDSNSGNQQHGDHDQYHRTDQPGLELFVHGNRIIGDRRSPTVPDRRCETNRTRRCGRLRQPAVAARCMRLGHRTRGLHVDAGRPALRRPAVRP